MEELLRDLVTLGLAGLLCLLRLEAATFSAAEYDEPAVDGRRSTFRLRIAWYLVGFALIMGILVWQPHPPHKKVPAATAVQMESQKR